jgi:hypothetical protein
VIVVRHKVPEKASLERAVPKGTNRRAHLHESHRTLRDGALGGVVPGTSCQPTISLSLRDKAFQPSKRLALS